MFDDEDDLAYLHFLLCDRCSLGLAHFNNDPRLLRRAADYLEAAAKAHRGGAKRPRGGSKKAGKRKR